MLSRNTFRPLRISFTHERPASLEVHHRVLGTAIEFSQECNAIVCRGPRSKYANPCRRSDAESRGEAIAGHAAGPRRRRAGAAGAPDRQDAATKRTLFRRPGRPASWHASTHS
ncbi:AraC family transcriptional regulator ligand-binding domain-containing protein [Caballeronia choica]|uniref:AraC family transcriptional regulator ligand-binding domain-containing protein n=1 Tax=Caballeronia choica TaxID=326476 RepID=UPI0022869473|nr:AraC family transcriptional regulator ligand-binding domain-containing protein [Caballeronia choica]